MADMNTVKEKLNELLRDKNVDLAYITKFGSHLYGTSTENSDLDLKGLFWPSIDNLILEEKMNSLSFSSGDKDGKNTKDDFDLQLWSVQYWLDLLKKGDTNAIDLLFSMYTDQNLRQTNTEQVKDLLGEFYDNPIDLIDLKNNTAYISYAYMQAKKYGLKGSRVDILKKILDFFSSRFNSETRENRIVMYFDDLLSKHYDDKMCFEKPTKDGERCIWILGKGFTGSTKLQEAYNRLDLAYRSFGHRAILAANNENVDFKAVSHAIRCCVEMNELIDTGFLKFPLSNTEEIMDVKLGKKDWLTYIEPRISGMLDEIKGKLVSVKSNNRMTNNHRSIIRRHYSQYLK